MNTAELARQAAGRIADSHEDVLLSSDSFTTRQMAISGLIPIIADVFGPEIDRLKDNYQTVLDANMETLANNASLRQRVAELERDAAMWRQRAECLRAIGEPKPITWEQSMWSEVTSDMDSDAAPAGKQS